jgi:hypothetical protein
MGRMKIGEFLIFIIVKFFAPILILLRQFGGWFKRVEKPPPPLSSPVNGEEGVWKDFLLFELLIYSPPPLSSPVKWGGRVKRIGK